MSIRIFLKNMKIRNAHKFRFIGFLSLSSPLAVSKIIIQNFIPVVLELPIRGIKKLIYFGKFGALHRQ